MPRVRVTIRDLLVIIFGCAVLFSMRPHIYWFYWIIAGSLAGFGLHRKMSGRGILGAIVGAGFSAVGIAIGAYLRPIDRGGPMQFGMRNHPEIEFTILFVMAMVAGVGIGLGLYFPILLVDTVMQPKRDDSSVVAESPTLE